MSFISDLFISDAFAQAPVAGSGGFMSFVPLIIIFIIFYFLLIRPQQKKAKLHQEMVSNLKIGNKICTNSGIFGTVKEIDANEGTIDLEIAKDVIIKVLKFSVNELVVKSNIKDKKTKTAATKKSSPKKAAKTKK